MKNTCIHFRYRYESRGGRFRLCVCVCVWKSQGIIFCTARTSQNVIKFQQKDYTVTFIAGDKCVVGTESRCSAFVTRHKTGPLHNRIKWETE